MNQPSYTQETSEGTILAFKVDFNCGRKRARADTTIAENANERIGRTPRIAKLVALAIKLDQLVRSGVVKDYAELARLGHVTRARMSQIMNLLNLAPDIMEELMFLPSTSQGRDRIAEHHVRKVLAFQDWAVQRRIWREIYTYPH